MSYKLHIDVETYSSVDLKTCGTYAYFESPDFEVLMVAYCYETGGLVSEVKLIDLASGEKLTPWLIGALNDETIELHAHNASFERNAFKAMGYGIPAQRWHCSAVKAGYCGLPMSLEEGAKALGIEQQKSTEGKALIRYFSCPVKPTKTNGGRMRNLPKHNPEKWERFKEYCKQDVRAEMGMIQALEGFELPKTERLNYVLDQKINDKGVRIDTTLVDNAILFDLKFKQEITERLKTITGLDNPNSVAQLLRWLNMLTGREIKTLAKDNVAALIKELDDDTAVEVLKLRQLSSKTSTKKFKAMKSYALADETAHGLLQFYGGSRTGRWAGRAVQLQNLPRNKMKLLDCARSLVRSGDYEMLRIMWDNVPRVLSELIRTALIPREGHTLYVADYSAIEGRITAWLAGEKWRLDVFAGDGKIYEASAAMMFNIPVESIGKGSEYRDKGKISELALGFGGSVGALKTMGGEAMGLSESEMKNIVERWRKASPAIVNMWYEFENCAVKALKIKKPVTSKLKGVTFNYEHKCLTILLPSGRKLVYQNPVLTTNQWGRDAIKYRGKDQTTGVWTWVETYGGKLSENIIQAIARDLLADGMRRLDAAGFDIVMHVHDEVVADNSGECADFVLSEMCRILGEPVPWAGGLGTPAEGFITNYYKKD
jgi:DNA polymerase